MKGMSGEFIEITSYQKIYDILPVKIIDVEDVDTYFAGTTPVVIHNDPNVFIAK
jgi:hypothetical protein